MKKLLSLKFKANQFKNFTIIFILIFSLIGCKKVDNETSVNTKSAIQYDSALSKIESDYGVKIGVYAFDTNTNKEVTFNADDRISYCSTFKALMVGEILKKYELDQLKHVVKYTQKDVLSYAPITKNHVDTGMTIEELCDAAIRFSDNTAANLLFDLIDGPCGFKLALNKLGDSVTEPARIEPELNNPITGDIKDTSTPRQLAIDLKEYTTGSILTDDKKKILINWMSKNTTGDNLIRAGAPKDWRVGDKSGSGPYGIKNDIAIVTPPNEKPIFVAILSMKDVEDAKPDDKPIAEASKIVLDYFSEDENIH